MSRVPPGSFLSNRFHTLYEKHSLYPFLRQHIRLKQYQEMIFKRRKQKGDRKRKTLFDKPLTKRDEKEFSFLYKN